MPNSNDVPIGSNKLRTQQHYSQPWPQVDRTGRVISCGPTSMEAAVMGQGGRTPDAVVDPSAYGTSAGCGTVAHRNAISARYINSQAQGQQLHLNWRGCDLSVSGTAMAPEQQSSAGRGGHARYTYIDEEYLRCLQSQMRWDRDNGIVHLMPIAVVYQEDEY